jgi:hypothetical protein
VNPADVHFVFERADSRDDELVVWRVHDCELDVWHCHGVVRFVRRHEPLTGQLVGVIVPRDATQHQLATVLDEAYERVRQSA